MKGEDRMALSGTLKKTFSGNSNYYIKGVWSATQNIANNTSTITLKTYFGSNSTYSLYGSGLKLTTWVDSKSANTSHNVSTSGGKEILLNTRTMTITHSADGTRKFNLHLIMDASMISISGRSLGKADTGNTTQTLNTIPRKSTLSSSKSFTATNDYSCTVSRPSSSFTHTLTFKNGATVLKSVSGIGASATIVFTEAERIEMLKLVDGRRETSITAELTTYNGSSNIGTNSYTIRLFEPARSTLNIPVTVNIGDSMSVNIGAYSTRFRHDIIYNINGQTGYIFSNTASGDYNYNFTALNNLLYSNFPNSINGATTFTLITKLGNYQRVNTESRAFTTPLNQKAPTFPDSPVSYLDTNSSSVAITGDNQFIISNKSTLQVNLNKLATAYNYATIREYTVMIGGVRKTSTSNTTQVFNLGQVNAKTGDTITITATDSRGLSNSINIPCKIIEYNNPSVTLSGERVSNFETLTKISILCDYSPLIVNGQAKNSISYLQIRYKKVDETAWSGYINLKVEPINSKQVRGTTKIELDNNFAYHVEGYAGDTTGGSVGKWITIQRGIPLMFIDTKKNSIGIGDFPQWGQTFESYMPTATRQEIIMDFDTKDMNKNIHTWYNAKNNTLFTEPSGATGETTWSMGDIKISPKSIGTNGNIWSGGNITGNSIDAVNDINAGRHVISGGNVASKGTVGIAYGTDRVQWINTAKLANGAIVTKIGTETVAYNGNKVLWNGADPMGAGAVVWLPIKITECPTGICLVWSAYTASTARDYHFTMTYFPKAFIYAYGEGRGVNQIIAAGYGSNDPSNQIHKYIYFHDNRLEGNSSNTSDTKQQSLILRGVIVY